MTEYAIQCSLYTTLSFYGTLYIPTRFMMNDRFTMGSELYRDNVGSNVLVREDGELGFECDFEEFPNINKLGSLTFRLTKEALVNEMDEFSYKINQRTLNHSLLCVSFAEKVEEMIGMEFTDVLNEVTRKLNGEDIKNDILFGRPTVDPFVQEAVKVKLEALKDYIDCADRMMMSNHIAKDANMQFFKILNLLQDGSYGKS